MNKDFLQSLTRGQKTKRNTIYQFLRFPLEGILKEGVQAYPRALWDMMEIWVLCSPRYVPTGFSCRGLAVVLPIPPSPYLESCFFFLMLSSPSVEALVGSRSVSFLDQLIKPTLPTTSLTGLSCSGPLSTCLDHLRAR